MRKALRISATTALTVASLSLIATMPLAAGRPAPAEQVTVAAINPFRLMERAMDLPVQQIEDFSMIY